MTKTSSHPHETISYNGYMYDMTHFASSSSTLVVSSGVSNLSIGSGGSVMTVDIVKGGAVSYSSIGAGGIVNIENDGIISIGSVGSGGEINVEHGGHLDIVTISAGAILNVHAHGSARNVELHGSADIMGAHVDRLGVTGGVATVTDGSYVSRIFVSATGVEGAIHTGTIDVQSATLVAIQVLESGIVNDGAGAFVSSAQLQFAGATLEVDNGGHAYNISATNGGTIVVESGSYLSDAYALGAKSILHVANGGHATDITVGGGSATVADHATLDGVTIMSGAVTVSSGGTEINAVVSNTGIDAVMSGAVISGLQILSGGSVDLLSLAYHSGGTVSFDATTHLLTVDENGVTETLQLSTSQPGNLTYTLGDDNGTTDITAGIAGNPHLVSAEADHAGFGALYTHDLASPITPASGAGLFSSHEASFAWGHDMVALLR